MSRAGRIVTAVAAILAVLFSVWPLSILVEESFSVDISPLFSGEGIRFIGGVPYYSGGIFPTLANFVDAFGPGGFPKLAVNSITIAALSIGVALLAGVPAGYSLARMKLRGGSAISFFLFALRTVSPFAVVLPLYLLFVQTGLWDRIQGMGLAYLAIDVPVVLWMLRGFFSDIPKEVYEAAAVSGASERETFLRVALPMVLPGIVVTAIFAFVLVWNEFLIASLLTGPAAKTVSVGIWTGAGEKVAAFKSVSWDDVNTFGTLAFVPAYLVVLGIRKYLARGFSLAAVR